MNGEVTGTVPANLAPTLDDLADWTLDEDAGQQTVQLTGISAGGAESQTLTVTATSSHPQLVPNPTVAYNTPSTTGSLTFTPLANQSGTALVTVTVTDNGGTVNGGVDTFQRSFLVTVQALNDSPVLAQQLPPVSVVEGSLMTVVGLGGYFQDVDIATGGDSLHYTAAVNAADPNDPDFDDLAAEILGRDAQGVLVLKHGRWPRTGQRLWERFRRTLADVLDRVVLLPWLRHEDYLHLLAAADVVLDTPHYGAGSTTYDIFSFDRPLVTWPGRFNIGRYTLACYRRMGIEDLVAHTAEDYVALAVRVGADHDFREAITARLAERTGLLFDDTAVVDEHVQFFRHVGRDGDVAAVDRDLGPPAETQARPSP